MIRYDIITFEVIRRYNNMQRPDGRGETARTRRQSLEERGERDGRGWGEKERPNEAKRGDTRRSASEVSRRARGDAAGRGEGVGQRKYLRLYVPRISS